MYKRMLFIQGGTVKCSKNAIYFKEEQCNVQKNAICSRRNSEMLKRMLFIQGRTVQCTKDCCLLGQVKTSKFVG